MSEVGVDTAISSSADLVGAVPRRAKRDKLVVVSLCFLALVVAAGVAASTFTSQNPNQQALQSALQPPWWSGDGSLHIFGTDALGRDLFARMLFGVRPLLIVVVTSVSLSGAFGLAYGVVAGMSRGPLGAVMMRLADIQLSIPPIVLALVLAVALTPGIGSMILAIALVNWPQTARIIRSEVMRVRTSEFVQLARVAGLGRFSILWHHIIPNAMNIFVVLCTLNLSIAIIFASGLSFLGMGVQPPTADWGRMLAEGTDYMQDSWWMMVVPGLAITLLVLALNVVGDRLRDMLDPRLRGAGGDR